MIGLFKNNMVRINLRFRSAEELYTVRAKVCQLIRQGHVPFQKRSYVRLEFTHSNAMIIYATAKVARYVGRFRGLIRIGR